MKKINFKLLMVLQCIFQILPWCLKSDFQKQMLSIQAPKQRLFFQGHLVSPDSQSEAPMARFSSSFHCWKTGPCWQHVRPKWATYYLIQQSCLRSTTRSDSGSWCLRAPVSKSSFRIQISFEFLFQTGFFPVKRGNLPWILCFHFSPSFLCNPLWVSKVW